MRKIIILAIISIFGLTLVTVLFYENLLKKDFEIVEEKETLNYKITDEVEGEVAIIFDIKRNKIIAEKNADEPVSIASITKLTSALVASEYINFNDVIEIKETDTDLSAHTPLKVGDRFQAKKLLEYSLITSSNIGMTAIGRKIEEKVGIKFVDLMNIFADDENLVQTHYVNPTGLDAHGGLSGSMSSAVDIAKIMRIFYRDNPELAFHSTRTKADFYTLDGREYEAQNTNKLLSTSSYKFLLSKTGFTDRAGGTLATIVEIKEDPYVIIVLKSTKENRFSDTLALIRLTSSLIEKEI